jgi:hypothetical protein
MGNPNDRLWRMNSITAPTIRSKRGLPLSLRDNASGPGKGVDPFSSAPVRPATIAVVTVAEVDPANRDMLHVPRRVDVAIEPGGGPDFILRLRRVFSE